MQKLLRLMVPLGQANHRGKVVAAGFACEALMVIVLTVIANDCSRVCPSRSPFQLLCAKAHCVMCAPGYLNCTGLLKMHVAGCLAYELIRQLPTDRRFHILNEENGVFFHADINWKVFHLTQEA